ncbi:hypothetical protein SAMN05660923_02971 [Tepidimicrobium xylanilyticum]|uniref:Uncharacterized protein n=1 Tax=Tepidimicrobium xylanilyticum TaxID=1123352 RepID=A0A1H3ESG2_9FIRM|nr:hypothetical protein SAMN05660923_02971 [Tepidimicrobium xylanilyticum]
MFTISEESVAASEELSSQAEVPRQLVKKFRLKNTYTSIILMRNLVQKLLRY